MKFIARTWLQFGCALLPEYGSKLVTEYGCVCCQNMTMVYCLLSQSIKVFNDCQSMGSIYCHILPEYVRMSIFNIDCTCS